MSAKKIAASKTKPRTSRNMQAFIRDQIPKTQPREILVMDALRTLLKKAFDRDENLPSVPEVAAYLNLTYESTRKALSRMEEKRTVTNVSHNPQRKIFVPNEPDYIGDDA